MDFLEYYTESHTEPLSEKMGDGGGLTANLDRIGRHPRRTGDSDKKSAVGLPKDVWNTSPPSSSEHRYMGSRENYNKIRNLEAKIKKLLMDQENATQNQIKKLMQDQQAQTSQTPQQDQNQQPQQDQNQPPANVPQEEYTSRRFERMIKRMKNVSKSMARYKEITNSFEDFISKFQNAFDMDPEELYKNMGELESALKIAKNGIEGMNDAASEVYRYLNTKATKRVALAFSRDHEAMKDAMDLEIQTLEKVIKDFKDDQEQKKLEAEKEKQDAIEKIKQTPQNYSEPEEDGFQAHEPEKVIVDKSKIKNIIKNKPSTKTDAELRTMIDKVRKLNPELKDQDLSDEEMLKLIQAENDRQRKELAQAESVSFSEFYALNEAPRGPGGGPTLGNSNTVGRMVGHEIDTQANSKYLLNRLGGRLAQKVVGGVSGMMKKGQKSKPTKTVQGIPQGMDKSRFFAVNYAGYTAANAACGKSLTEYRTFAKENGLGAAKKMGTTFVMVNQRDNVEAEGDIKSDIDPFYKFTDDISNMKLMEGTEWRTTNFGYIFTMSGIVNFDLDDDNVEAEISQDERKNVRYFVGCDAKGMEFFADNFHMSFRQYLQNARTTTPAKQFAAMDDALAQATGDAPGSETPAPQPAPVVVMNTRTITDTNEANEVKANVEAYIKKYKADLATRKAISNGQQQGYEVTFKNGEAIKYYATDNGELVVNVSDAILQNDETFDPNGKTKYTKVQ